MFVFTGRLKQAWAVWAVMSILLAVAGCSSSGNASFDDTIQATSDYIQKEMEKFDAVGLSIALVSGNRIVWAQGFGWADKENQIPASADSVFMLGSGAKTLTTAALLKLHEQGMVAIDNPAASYIPEFDMAPRYLNQMREITVRRLLNHHSGLPGDLFAAGFLYGEAWNDYGCNLYMDFLLDYLKTDYPSHPPGEMATYCNTGFVLAGEIALRQGGLPGESYSDYLKRTLFNPLGMVHTSLRTIRENLARGYAGGHVSEIKETNCTFGATGGAYTTVKDIARFMIMVNSGGKMPDGSQFLKPETVALLGDVERSPLDIDSMFQPGLGLDSMDDPVMKYAGRAWMKSGSTGDYHSLMEMLPDLKLGAVVLTNSDTAHDLPLNVVRECLKNAVFEKYNIPPSAPPLPGYESENDPARIEGIYVKKYGYDKIIHKGDGALTWLINAHNDDPDTAVLSFRNRAYESDTRTESIIFRNIQWNGGDYFVMIQSGSSGSNSDESIYGGYVRTIVGEKVVPGTISEVWKNRQGLYVLDNAAWNDMAWASPFIELSEKDGLLILDRENAAIPQDDAAAFIVGLTHRSDSSIRFIEEDGKEKMLCSGYRAYSMARIPPIAPGDVVHGTTALFKSDWFRLEAVSPGQRVDIAVTTDSEHYALTLFDENGVLIGREMGAISWTVGQGSCYLAVSPTPDVDGNYTMTVN